MFRASLLATALLATGLAGAAQAQQVINQGEESSVTYPPGYTGNIVGGGEIKETIGGGPSVIYTHANHSMPPNGMPAQIGGREGGVVYLPDTSGTPTHHLATR